MTIEVLARDLGVATTTDIQDVLVDARDVLLLVLRSGGSPIRERIELGCISAGRGVHRGLICPVCGVAKYKLFAAVSSLSCGTCLQRRSRRQLEHRSRSWQHLGGALEDVVLRGLRAGGCSRTIPDQICAAADRLVVDDHERVALILQRVDAAAAGVGAGEVSVGDILQREDQ